MPFKNETPDEARERMKQMSADERAGFEQQSEGQVIARTGELLDEEALQAREERLAPLIGRPFGSKSLTDLSGEQLDREAASTQDEPNRPTLSNPQDMSNVNEAARAQSERVSRRAGSDDEGEEAGSSGSRGSSRSRRAR